MKTTLRRTLATLVTLVATGLLGSTASADEQVSSLLFTCNLSFKATGKSIYVGVGYTDVEGSGTISCYDLLTGATQHLPVKVKARGPGAGLGVTGLVLSGAATGVGVTKGPENLLGRYGMIRGNAAVGVGAAGGVALRLSNGSVTIDVSLEAQSGLGAGVDLLWIDIESDGSVRTELAKAPAAPVIAAPATPQPVRVSASKTIYLSEGQPLQIIDSQGRVLQTIYLKPARP
ncbi:MAG: hypothetical protein JNJ49_17530 [Bdellovibrionaceae bacterium]|nr:hypothetical protein [Pseudobdellovibrionaceae bacterium]